MKWLGHALIRGLIIGIGFGLFIRLYAATDVSIGVNVSAPADFYAPLTPSGAWVDVGNYGHCWHPAHVEAGWRPYCDGEWVSTDDGWYWQSDEPWAWATYHYGSWVYTEDTWYWVPDTVWAPAWVEWRTGGGYCGWAPCGPPGFVIIDPFFVFCDERHFGDHHHRGDVIINNTTIINKTKIINKTEVREDRSGGGSRRIGRNDGPGVDEIQKATGKKFTPRPVAEVDRSTVAKAPKEIRERKATPAGNNPDNKTLPKVEDREKNGQLNTAPDRNLEKDKTLPKVNDNNFKPNDNLKPDNIKPDNKPDFKPSDNLPKHEDITPPDHPTHVLPPDVNGPIHTAPDHPLKDVSPGPERSGGPLDKAPGPGGRPDAGPRHEGGPAGGPAGGPPVHEGEQEGGHDGGGNGKDKP